MAILLEAKDKKGEPRFTNDSAKALLGELTDEEIADGLLFNRTWLTCCWRHRLTLPTDYCNRKQSCWFSTETTMAVSCCFFVS